MRRHRPLLRALALAGCLIAIPATVGARDDGLLDDPSETRPLPEGAEPRDLDPLTTDPDDAPEAAPDPLPPLPPLPAVSVPAVCEAPEGEDAWRACLDAVRAQLAAARAALEAEETRYGRMRDENHPRGEAKARIVARYEAAKAAAAEAERILEALTARAPRW